MIRKVLLWFIAIAIVGGSLYGVYAWQHQEVTELTAKVAELDAELSKTKNGQEPVVKNYEYTSEKGVVIKVYIPDSGEELTSPVIVMGEVPGNWSFEASFPIKIVDEDGSVIVQAAAQLQNNWMTEELVPFISVLTFENASSGNATLVLEKDNPSDLEANDDSVEIPITLS
ncbi:hypothetical protein EOL96_06250 [Candidatus Saccharibacteria bacterium]|nr:hypothetical protein [Candidatus Saccharibacteria bacterium]